MRLACVPFPAPGGPSSTTGPTAREVSCAIGLAKASRPQSPRRPRNTTEVQQPPQPIPAFLPDPAAAHTPTTRREPIVVAHDHPRFDLRNRIHRHTDDDQQRRTTKIEAHT